VADLCELVDLQIERMETLSGAVLNVGGGPDASVSLRELTGKCEARAGRRIRFTGVAETAPADIPYYVTDNSGVRDTCGWSPRRSVDALLDDVFRWLREGGDPLRALLG
jgi:CDP-paratose 2-epimerase